MAWLPSVVPGQLAHTLTALSDAERRYPVVLTMLRERQLCISGIRVIAQYLNDENYEARLQEARGKTRDELYVLVAAWAPKP